MIYVASPYSHPERAVREKRYQIAVAVTTRLLAAGWPVYSPIVNTHPLITYAMGHKNPVVAKVAKYDHSFWMKYDRQMMLNCDRLIIIAILGWEESKGVQEEREFFNDRYLPIAIISPEITTRTDHIKVPWATRLPSDTHAIV